MHTLQHRNTAETADQAFIQKATNCNNIRIQTVASVEMDVEFLSLSIQAAFQGN